MEFITNMIMRYYDVLTHNSFNSPNFTDLIRLAESILNKEPIENAEDIKRIESLYNKVPPVNIEMPKLELIFFKNNHKGIQAEIDINGTTYTLGDLFTYINDVIQEITKIVSKVAYKYDLEIPLEGYGGGKRK